MLERLYKRLIPFWDQFQNPTVRGRYGALTGTFGLIINILLAAGKILVGSLSGSMAITADGFNNFADAASSVIALISFKLATKPADHKHPFGHARIEYIAATIVGLMTLLIAFEIGKSAIQKIISPEPVQFSWLYAVVLAVSILLKLLMFYVNRKTGKMIDSKVMEATAIDSISDVGVTSGVLLSLLFSPFLSFPLDGVIALIVALFIVKAGYDILKDTFNALIGERPSKALENNILRYIRENPLVLGVHDLVVHDYGPGRTFTSAHVEVDAAKDILELHEAIDSIERELAEKEGISLVLHMDPIVVDDPKINELRNQIDAFLRQIDPLLSMHDFRVMPGRNRTNLIFDVEVPPEYESTDAELKERIDREVREIDPHYYTMIAFDRSFIDLKPTLE